MRHLKTLILIPLLLPLMAFGSCQNEQPTSTQAGVTSTDTGAMNSRPSEAMKVAAHCPKARNAYGECLK